MNPSSPPDGKPGPEDRSWLHQPLGSADLDRAYQPHKPFGDEAPHVELWERCPASCLVRFGQKAQDVG